MKLLYKPDMCEYEIFDIIYDKHGYPYFLIYRKNQWVRKSAKYFTPNYHKSNYMLVPDLDKDK